MPKKTKSTWNYKYSLQEVKELFAKELKVPVDSVKVTYQTKEKEYTGKYADPRDNNSYTVVSGVTVSVKDK